MPSLCPLQGVLRKQVHDGVRERHCVDADQMESKPPPAQCSRRCTPKPTQMTPFRTSSLRRSKPYCPIFGTFCLRLKGVCLRLLCICAVHALSCPPNPLCFVDRVSEFLVREAEIMSSSILRKL